MKLPIIEGREVIPLRLIPFIIGFNRLAPDALVKLLAQKEGLRWPIFSDDDKLNAYQFRAGGQPSRIMPREWDSVIFEIDLLEKKNRIKENFENENYPAWRLEALNKLPVDAFVWRDEFEHLHELSLKRKVLSLSEKRDDDYQLNFTPMIDPESWTILIESFEVLGVDLISGKNDDLSVSSDSLENKSLLPSLPKAHPKEIESLLKMVIVMAIDGYGYNPEQKKSPIPSEITIRVESLGLSINDDTVRKWLKKSAELLPSDWRSSLAE